MAWRSRVRRRGGGRVGSSQGSLLVLAIVLTCSLPIRTSASALASAASGGKTNSAGLILLDNEFDDIGRDSVPLLESNKKQVNSENFNAFRSSKIVNNNEKNVHVNSESSSSNVAKLDSDSARRGKKLTWGEYISKSSEIPFTPSRETTWGSRPELTEVPFINTRTNQYTNHNSHLVQNLNNVNNYSPTFSQNQNSNYQMSQSNQPNYAAYTEPRSIQSFNIPANMNIQQPEVRTPVASDHVLDQLTQYLLHGNDDTLANLATPAYDPNPSFQYNRMQPQESFQQNNNKQLYYTQNDHSVHSVSANQQPQIVNSFIPRQVVPQQPFQKQLNDYDPTYDVTEDYSTDDIDMKQVLKDLSTLIDILPEMSSTNSDDSSLSNNMNSPKTINTNVYVQDSLSQNYNQNSELGTIQSTSNPLSQYFQTPGIQPIVPNLQKKVVNPLARPLSHFFESFTSSQQMKENQPSIRSQTIRPYTLTPAKRTTLPNPVYRPVQTTPAPAQSFTTTTDNSYGTIIFTSKPIFTKEPPTNRNQPNIASLVNNVGNHWSSKVKGAKIQNQHSTPESYHYGSHVYNKSKSNDYEESFFTNKDYEYVDTQDESWKSRNISQDEGENETQQKAQRRTLDLLYHMFVDPTTDDHGHRRNTLFEDVVKAIDSHIIGDIKALKEHNHSGKTGQSHFNENNSDFFKTLIESIGLDRNFMKSTANAFSELSSPLSASATSSSSTRVSPEQTYHEIKPFRPISNMKNPETKSFHSINLSKPSTNGAIYSGGTSSVNGKPKVQPLPSGNEFVVTDPDGSQQIVSIDDIINSLAALDEREVTELLLGSDVSNRRSDQDVDGSMSLSNQNQMGNDGSGGMKINNFIVLGENGRTESIPFKDIGHHTFKGMGNIVQPNQPSPVVMAAHHLLGHKNHHQIISPNVTPSPTIKATQVLLGLSQSNPKRTYARPEVISTNKPVSTSNLFPNDRLRVSFSHNRDLQNAASHRTIDKIPVSSLVYQEDLLKQKQHQLQDETEKLKQEEQRLIEMQKQLQRKDARYQHQAAQNIQDQVYKKQSDEALEKLFGTILQHQQEQIKREQIVRNQNQQSIQANNGAQKINSAELQNQMTQIQQLQQQIQDIKEKQENIYEKTKDLINQEKSGESENPQSVHQISTHSARERFHRNSQANREKSAAYDAHTRKSSSSENDTSKQLDRYHDLFNLRNKLPVMMSPPSKYKGPHTRDSIHSHVAEKHVTPPPVKFHTPPDISKSHEKYPSRLRPSSHDSRHPHNRPSESSRQRTYDPEDFRKQVQRKNTDDEQRQSFASTMYDQVLRSLPKPIHFKKTTTPPPPERPQIFGFDLPNIFPTERRHDHLEEEDDEEEGSKEDLKWSDPLGLLTLYDFMPFRRQQSNDRTKSTTPKPLSRADRFQAALKQGNVPSHVSKILVNQMKEKDKSSPRSKIPESIRRHTTGYSSSRSKSSRRAPSHYGQPIAHRRSYNHGSKSHHSGHQSSSDHSSQSHKVTRYSSRPTSYRSHEGFGPPNSGSLVSHSYGAPHHSSHQQDSHKHHYGSGSSSKEYDSYIVPLGYKGPPPKDQPFFDLSFLFNSVKVAKTGEDNESISLPKIGDPSKFVNIHRPPHY